MNTIPHSEPAFHTRQHPIVIAFALGKAFVKITLFFALYNLISNTANINTPLIDTLPPVFQILFIASLTWVVVAPLLHDISLYISLKINVTPSTFSYSQGFIFSQSLSLPREQIRGVTIVPSSLGKKFGYAEIIIVHKRNLTLRNISEPINLQNAILKGQPQP